MSRPSIRVLYCGKALRRASVARQSYRSAPVQTNVLHVGERKAMPPIAGRLGVGPTRGAQAPLQIGELVFRNLDTEGSDVIRAVHLPDSSSKGAPEVARNARHVRIEQDK